MKTHLAAVKASRLGRAALLALALVGTVASAEAPADKKTERTWKAKCASCHGTDGKGQTDQGKKMKVRDMTSAEWQKATTDEAIKKSMNEGINTTKDGVKQEMESYKDSLKPEQMEALTAYIRGFGKK